MMSILTYRRKESDITKGRGKLFLWKIIYYIFPYSKGNKAHLYIANYSVSITLFHMQILDFLSHSLELCLQCP